MTAGGVYIKVDVLYQQLEDPPTQPPNRTVAGFPARVLADQPAWSAGCPPATTSTLSATIAPAHLEPTEVDISACFGGLHTGAQKRAVAAMLATAKLVTRAPDDTHIRGATSCTAAQLSVGLGPHAGGVSQTEAILYTLRNISRRACRIAGFPTVRLESRAGAMAAIYRDGGGPYGHFGGNAGPNYLRPGSYASFLVSHGRCQQGVAHRAVAARIAIPVSGVVKTVSLVVTDRTGTDGLFLCADQSQTIYLSPLKGY